LDSKGEKMMNLVYLLKDENGKTLEVYNNKDVVKKIMPMIEAKLLVNIVTVEEVPLNPPVDLVGNTNFRKIYTVKEFIENA